MAPNRPDFHTDHHGKVLLSVFHVTSMTQRHGLTSDPDIKFEFLVREALYPEGECLIPGCSEITLLTLGWKNCGYLIILARK